MKTLLILGLISVLLIAGCTQSQNNNNTQQNNITISSSNFFILSTAWPGWYGQPANYNEQGIGTFAQVACPICKDGTGTCFSEIKVTIRVSDLPKNSMVACSVYDGAKRLNPKNYQGPNFLLAIPNKTSSTFDDGNGVGELNTGDIIDMRNQHILNLCCYLTTRDYSENDIYKVSNEICMKTDAIQPMCS
jgi:hypothetical protein